jgi:hypothetical protein
MMRVMLVQRNRNENAAVTRHLAPQLMQNTGLQIAKTQRVSRRLEERGQRLVGAAERFLGV